jgi:hypothetical protein
MDMNAPRKKGEQGRTISADQWHDQNKAKAGLGRID